MLDYEHVQYFVTSFENLTAAVMLMRLASQIHTRNQHQSNLQVVRRHALQINKLLMRTCGNLAQT